MAKNSKRSTNTAKKAVSSIMVARSFKKTERASSTNIESLPKELLTEVLARVGSSSLTDVFNAKLSCKSFHEAVEDAHVYRHVSLDDIPLVAWKPIGEKQQAFLAKCEKYQNPEIMYRQAVVDIFSGKKIESGIRYLQNAMKLKHIGAMYTTCIILLFIGTDKWKEKSKKKLTGMKKSKLKRRELKVHRDKLISMLRSIWVEKPLMQHRPIYCTKHDHHKKRTGWPDEEEEEEDVHCEACNVDIEVKYFSDIFSRR